MGPVLACGERAWLSHTSSAARVWELRGSADGKIESTIATRN